MRENKFIVIDATDVMCIGGFGNDLGNKGLLKYSEEEIAKMIMENNNTTDNTRLANSLLRTIRNQDNIINELEKILEFEKNNYRGNIDIETHNIDSEFLRGNSWEADYILDSLQELKGGSSND